MLFPQSLYNLYLCSILTVMSGFYSLAARGSSSCSTGSVVLGTIETINIGIPTITRLEALLDTGAANSAINARNIRVERSSSGKQQVSFQIQGPQSGQWINLKRHLFRYAWVQTHTGKPIKRMVVKLSVQLGNIVQNSEFYLMDRYPYKQPVLLGRSFLNKRVIVDVSKSHQAGTTSCQREIKKNNKLS